MPSNRILSDILKQAQRDQAASAAEQRRAAVNAHYDALQWALQLQHAADMNAIRARFGGTGQSGL